VQFVLKENIKVFKLKLFIFKLYFQIKPLIVLHYQQNADQKDKNDKHCKIG